MKTAVVYYSIDGNCGFVAEQIKTLLNADLVRLYTQDEKQRSGIAKFFWCLGMVFSRKMPPLKPHTFDSSAYDLIIIGAPVWAGSSAPPVHTFLSQAGIKGKRVALFVCHAGGKGSSLEKFKALLAGNDIIAAADFKEPAKNDNEALKQLIADWVRGF